MTCSPLNTALDINIVSCGIDFDEELNNLRKTEASEHELKMEQWHDEIKYAITELKNRKATLKEAKIIIKKYVSPPLILLIGSYDELIERMWHNPNHNHKLECAMKGGLI